MEKGDGDGTPGWLQTALGWAPKKWGELKSFFSEVRSELKKVTWPSRDEVKNTTMVVVLTTVFFGFYLYGLDLIMSQVFTRIVKQ